jgi:glycosyltransferase involved in cell wall biosynthesis
MARAMALRVGVVIPARDEQATVGRVVSELLGNRTAGVSAAVVCDNGSTDNTAAVARAAGAIVVTEPVPGYGRACLRAMAALPDVDVVLFIDGDGQFEASAATSLIEAIHGGADLAIGSRALGRMERGALSLPQRFGNWLATRLIRLLWNHRFTDLGPYRAVRLDAFRRLRMSSLTFGWTVEMQVKAIQSGLKCVEVPVATHRRVGRSKISGTVRGVVGAGVGILTTIFALWWCERTRTRIESADSASVAP